MALGVPMACVPDAGPETVYDAIGFHPAKGMSYDDWAEHADRIALYAKASLWWIGDWLLYGERRFGEDRAAAALDLGQHAGLEYSTVRSARWLAAQIPSARRRANLSWSHHREVGSLAPAEQDRWLLLAERDGLSRDELRRAIRDDRAEPEISSGAALTEQPEEERPNPAVTGTAGASLASNNVVPIDRDRPITEGYDDSASFLEACRLRFGEDRGAQVYAFAVGWAQRWEPKLAERLAK